MTANSFGSRATIEAGGATHEIYRLDAVDGSATLPYSLKVLLENLLRNEDGLNITADHITALANWDPDAQPDTEIQFTPARVILQDLTGVPAVVDLAAMREAMQALGGDPKKINPLIPAELVIDHSVVADFFGRPDAFDKNVALEFQRNSERFQFLRWGQDAFDGFRVVPPGTGIVHQVNIEHLARVVMTSRDKNGSSDKNGSTAYPDTCVGTDSHTTMENGLGILGWGVGGIEAEAAMLGQPISMLIPRVVGFRLTGQLPPATTATDLVLTITQILRKHGVVGKFVEFHGEGVAEVPVANRATIGNMSPEFGSTCAIFPIDSATIDYLRLTGRSESQLDLVEKYARAQGLWHSADSAPRYSEELTLDLGTIVPSIAGPKRPQDRIELANAKTAFRDALPAYTGADNGSFPASDPGEQEDIRATHQVQVTLEDGTQTTLDHGHVVIAAITSCTNTSNPFVMMGAALLAKKAVEKGLSRKPWVKTTLAPGSKVVMDYYERAGLLPYLDKLGFNLVGYGCTTCIGNSGPLPEAVSAAVNANDLTVVSVLSGNRNFEGRINPDVQMNYLASPPLVVAYSLAGTMDIDLDNEPLGTDQDGRPVFLADIWPSPQEVQAVVASSVAAEMFTADYADVFAGDDNWRGLDVPTGDTFAWAPTSTYVARPPYFDGMPANPAPVTDIHGAKVLAKLGDSVTTDHISPAGAIKATAPAGLYLSEHGIERADFNSYGSRRGNHEVMIRGTFANIRLRNQLAPGTEGGVTVKDGVEMSIYDASRAYLAEGTPLIVIGGKEYGSGSSRDWAAKGTALLGVRAVLVESFERIHRSNLIGMGVLPLQFKAGESAESLGLSGQEIFNIEGIERLNSGIIPNEVVVTADGKCFTAIVRIDTPGEADYYRHGGIMQYVLRSLLASE
jgi:aconitate hydratase